MSRNHQVPETNIVYIVLTVFYEISMYFEYNHRHQISHTLENSLK